ncbi:MAG: hypothetical protein M1822_009984 [Bathelium mastoideum]|nr:MAG: hypothetical protein M1822_009984 [Bathelium mastoideum]
MTRPNFLIVVADDLGFSDTGAYGSEIRTPYIDALAQDGVRFTDFHAASACSPTRSMLLSGTDHHIAGIGTMIESIKDFQRDKPGYEGYLNDKVVSLPELLRDNGYKTYMSGKWHLGLSKERWPCSRGFDRSFSLLPGAANHYAYEPQLEGEDKRPALLARTPPYYVEDDKHIPPKDLGPNFYSTDAFADKLLQYLSERTKAEREQPFFAYLAFSAPHWPLQAPEEDILSYRGRYDDGPEALRQERVQNLKKKGLVPEHAIPHDVVAPHKQRLMSRDWDALSSSEKAYSSRTMEVYAGMVQRLDSQLGRVLDYLRSTQELDNTFIIFMSDNGAEGTLLEAAPIMGENIFEHIDKYYNNSLDNMGRFDSYVWYGPHWASAGTAPSRLYKAFIAEGGIRVPLILRYPPLTSARPEESIEHTFCTVMDLYPTILDLAHATYPTDTYHGRAIVPLRGKSWLDYLAHQLSISSSSTNGEPTVAPARIHADETVHGWELFGRLAVRQGRWKAAFIPRPYGPEVWELFDLDADPGETRSVAAEHPEKLRELLRAWSEYVGEVGVVKEPLEYGTLVVEEGKAKV